MNSYPLRALTLNGKLYVFSVHDGITCANSGSFFLMNVPLSPRLHLDTIHRGTENGEYFEGDLVKTRDGNVHEMKYTVNGFFVDNIPLAMCLDTISLITCKLPTTFTKLRFKHNNEFLSLSRLRGVKDNYLISAHNKWTLIDSRNVQQHTLTNNLYFGDEVDSLKVILYKGRVCFKDMHGNLYIRNEDKYETI